MPRRAGARPIKTRRLGKRRVNPPPEAASGWERMNGHHRTRAWAGVTPTSAARARWGRVRTKGGRGERARHPLLDKMAINGARRRVRQWAGATTSGARDQRLRQWAGATINGARGQETLAQEARRTISGVRRLARRWAAAMTNGARGQPYLLLRGVETTSGGKGQPHLRQWGVITTNGARAQPWVDVGRINGARPMAITQARQKIRALTCVAEHDEEPSQRLRQMDNGDKGIGARQTLAGTMLNRLVSGGNPPRPARFPHRPVRLNQATAAPTTRVAWAINLPMLVAAGASARLRPGKPNPGASNLPGRRPVGNRLSRSQQVHAAPRAIKPRRSPNGTSRAGARLRLPGKPQGQAVSGARLNRPRASIPAALLSQRAREA